MVNVLTDFKKPMYSFSLNSFVRLCFLHSLTNPLNLVFYNIDPCGFSTGYKLHHMGRMDHTWQKVHFIRSQPVLLQKYYIRGVTHFLHSFHKGFHILISQLCVNKNIFVTPIVSRTHMFIPSTCRCKNLTKHT